jgi:hypothetical protein
MARKPRFNLPGVPQHVIQRGNNRDPCFLSEEDHQRYLADLGSSPGTRYERGIALLTRALTEHGLPADHIELCPACRITAAAAARSEHTGAGSGNNIGGFGCTTSREASPSRIIGGSPPVTRQS